MSKTISKFRFKQFAVSHHRSSMKVGVDGVLIGCWTEVNGAKRILDVGTGCGLIALIMAQRAPGALIDAIDIDAPSIEEATENFLNSPWSDRLNAVCCGYSDVSSLLKDEESRYDLIVSNPPYYNSGMTETITAREKARHQGDLSPSRLLKGALALLNEGGSVAMVVPTDIMIGVERYAVSLGYREVRKCLVKGHDTAPYKRILLQWILSNNEGTAIDPIEFEYLTLEFPPGEPTEEYRSLCKDFYFRF